MKTYIVDNIPFLILKLKESFHVIFNQPPPPSGSKREKYLESSIPSAL